MKRAAESARFDSSVDCFLCLARIDFYLCNSHGNKTIYSLLRGHETRRNFFDTTMRAVSLRTLFAGTRRSHGRSNCKFDAALGLLNLWQNANRFAARVAVEALGWRRAAHVAQLVEHVLGKDEVTGSIPVMGSR